MKMTVNDVTHTVPDEIVKEQVGHLFAFLMSKYTALSPMSRMGIQGMARAFLVKYPLGELEKGQDPVDFIAAFIPQHAAEALKDVELSFRTSQQNNPPTITDFIFHLSREGESR